MFDCITKTYWFKLISIVWIIFTNNGFEYIFSGNIWYVLQELIIVLIIILQALNAILPEPPEISRAALWYRQPKKKNQRKQDSTTLSDLWGVKLYIPNYAIKWRLCASFRCRGRGYAPISKNLIWETRLRHVLWHRQESEPSGHILLNHVG
jgi:hypothetical protein